MDQMPYNPGGYRKEEILPPLTDEEKMWAGLCYPLWPVMAVWILKSKRKKDLFLFFHALQGLYFGIFTMTASFVIGLLTYLIFIYPYTRVISQKGVPLEGSAALTKGTSVIVVILLYTFGLLIVFFISLWLGSKASNGSIFRLPIIGDKAYAIVDKKRTDLERSYLESLSEPLFGGKQESGPPPIPDYGYSYDAAYGARTGYQGYPPQGYYPPQAYGPPAGEAAPAPGTPLSYEDQLIMNPPVEKIRDILSQPSITMQQEMVKQSEFEPEVETAVQDEPSPVEVVQRGEKHKAGTLSPLERLVQLRKEKEGEEANPVNVQRNVPVEEPPGRPEEEPVEEDSSNSIKFLQPEEQIALLRKKFEETQGRPAGADTLKAGDSGENIPEAPQKTTFLDPSAQFELLRKKYEEISGPGIPKEIKRRKRTAAEAASSPLARLSQIQKQRKSGQAEMSDQERKVRSRALMHKMEIETPETPKKSGGIKYRPVPPIPVVEDDDDDIF